MQVEAALKKFDPLDPEVLRDPYPTYARLRDEGPLCRGGPGQWVVTRHREVSALLSDPRLGHAFPDAFYRFSVGDGPAASFFQHIVLDRDPPAHTRLRMLLRQGFAPARIAALTGRVTAFVDKLMRAAIERGKFDLVADFALPLPLMVIADAIGLPETDHALIRPRAADLAEAFGLGVPAAKRAAANEAVAWLRCYLNDLLAERRRAPRDDFVGYLASSDEAKHASPEEILDNLVFLLFAGFETTMNLIANGSAALLDSPGEMARIRADPGLAPMAVEEFLRYDASIQTAARLVLEPVEIGGRKVRAGRVLVLLFGSANRDPLEFVGAERLDIGRRPNRHVSFGGGAHHCLGAALARLEGVIAFTHFVTRLSSLERAGEAIRRPIANFRSFASLPVFARPA